MSIAAKELAIQGYTILKKVIPAEDIANARKTVLDYMKTHACLENASGWVLPLFIEHPELQSIAAFKDLPAVQTALKEAVDGAPIRFCNHSDIGVNRIVNWHKDVLRDNDYARYQKEDPWGESPPYRIYKVAVYLQDHTTTNDCLQVVPGSHLNPRVISAVGIHLHPAAGDILIFDQRITHRGTATAAPTGAERIMVSFGFGLANSCTDNFEAGTLRRQQDQLRKATSYVK